MMARVLYFILEPARAPANIVAGIMNKVGRVETRSSVENGTSENASAIFWIAGVTIPTPMEIKKMAIIAMLDARLL